MCFNVLILPWQEMVDLAEKVRLTKSAINNSRQHRIELLRAQYPFSALYRRMGFIIALQWNSLDEMVRRIQLRFTSVQDFDSAFALLHSIGCPLSSPVPVGTSRPSSAASSTNRPGSNENLHSSTHRPSLSSLQSRPQTSFDQHNLTTSDLPHNYHHPHTSSPSFYTASEQLQRSFSSPFTPAARPTTPYRPSSELFPINENPEMNSDKVTTASAFRPSFDRLEVPSFTAPQSDPVMSHTSMTPTTSRFIGDFLPPKSRDRPSTAAPTTFSNLVQFENDLADMVLPPKRELPAGMRRTSSSVKSSANPGSRDGPLSRPSTATAQQNQPQFSSPFSTGIRPPQPELSSRPSSTGGLPPLPEPTFATNNEADKIPRTAMTAENVRAARQEGRPSTAAGTMQKPTAPAKRPATGKKVPARPSTALPHASANMGSSSPVRRIAAELDVVDLDADIALPETSSHAQSHLNAQLKETFSKASAALSDPSSVTMQGDDKENLANYAALGYDQRMNIIENMLIASVEDENFIKLSQDVFGCWQRIGLDM
ncbi:hypothetical protein EJ08DRAFT_300605 [Tothia fuscella]|uniref:Uncharacterized protein n=1 Tax=Tothia fuscella TaxID=1048955 RepID=A0A9P4TXZ2_9PEZI|nr:hypothetical protein EJ08DRAFT_300605 [Tothia fuscella]